MALNRILLVSAAIAALLSTASAQAATLAEALAAAYANNATLNSARAGTRATDEEVPQALSGYRPRVNAFASTGLSSTNQTGDYRSSASLTTGFTITQPIFSGFRTENGVKAAEAAVRASRESLRNTEQNVLYDAVVAYMNVIRETAILELRRANVGFLNEQVRAARDRFQVGEGTRTDVAQAEAAVAGATSLVSLAQANLQAAIGTYRQVIGRDPSNLRADSTVDRLLPRTLDAAINESRAEHPAILAAVHNADTAAFNVKIVEGELLPTLSLEASAQRSWQTNDGRSSVDSAQIIGRLNIPIYEGGETYSRVRQAKEVLGQRRIEVDVARDQVYAALIAAWGGLEAARSQTVAARAQVDAAQLALEGVIEEQRVGQRTTLDVLNTQNDVTDARVALVQAERDVVVAGYAVLSAVGRLSATRLGLAINEYKPEQHYKQVRDKWIGLRTPDGR